MSTVTYTLQGFYYNGNIYREKFTCKQSLDKRLEDISKNESLFTSSKDRTSDNTIRFSTLQVFAQ